MSEQIIVTTGIYDLMKEQIRRGRVTKAEEEILNEELRTAKLVTRKELPDNVVTVNRRVTIKDHTLNTENTYLFVDTNKEKKKKGKYSITCDIAMATIGKEEGRVIVWPFEGGERKIEILKVETV